MKDCFVHEYVHGFGAMGDAVTCAKCGLSKYPEVAPGLAVSRILGKYHDEREIGYDKWVKAAQLAAQIREITK